MGKRLDNQKSQHESREKKVQQLKKKRTRGKKKNRGPRVPGNQRTGRADGVASDWLFDAPTCRTLSVFQTRSGSDVDRLLDKRHWVVFFLPGGEGAPPSPFPSTRTEDPLVRMFPFVCTYTTVLIEYLGT